MLIYKKDTKLVEFSIFHCEGTIAHVDKNKKEEREDRTCSFIAITGLCRRDNVLVYVDLFTFKIFQFL